MEYKNVNIKKWYGYHPLLPLYGDNDVPYYNALYSKKIINCSDNGSGSQTDNNPTITPYIVEGAKKCVIIYPGGGYFQRSDNTEGMCVANEYNKYGISAFVLRYRIGNDSKPQSGYNLDAILADGQRAVQYVRYYAEEFGIDPNQIAVCGFSAGGHLAMMVSTNEHKSNVVGDEIGEISSIPNAVILCYAVTTLLTGTFSSMPSILSGEDLDLQVQICNMYSGQQHITSNVAPTFVWYGDEDSTVKPEYNSVAYCEALKAAGVYCEMYEYKGVGHAVGLNAGSGITSWLLRSINFLYTVWG